MPKGEITSSSRRIQERLLRLELVAAALILRDDRILLVWHKKLQEWLPPGGHIEQNETPDDAAKREALEETGLEVEISDSHTQQIEGVTRNLPVPFVVDVHNVGDHDHCCFYYLAEPKNRAQVVILKKDEVENHRWFTEHELNGSEVPIDVQQISRLALKQYVQARVSG